MATVHGSSGQKRSLVGGLQPSVIPAWASRSIAPFEDVAVVVGESVRACVCGKVQRSREEGGALSVLAGGVLVSLITFAVAASFYPIAYHPFFYYLAGLGVAVRRRQPR